MSYSGYDQTLESSNADTSGVQILVLDDSLTDLRLMRCVMEDLNIGYPVEYFERTFTLLSWLDRKMHDEGTAALIFLDWRLNQALTEENSLQLIKAHPMGALSPVAVMSNSMNHYDQQRSLELGANYVFRKPDTYPQLLSQVRKILKEEYLLD